MILFCFGTRPEWIKIKPIVTKFNKEDYKILFTGQHTTLVNIDEDVTIEDIYDEHDSWEDVVYMTRPLPSPPTNTCTILYLKGNIEQQGVHIQKEYEITLSPRLACRVPVSSERSAKRIILGRLAGCKRRNNALIRANNSSRSNGLTI